MNGWDPQADPNEPSEKKRERIALQKKGERYVQDDLRTLERMPEFRRFMGRLLERCGLTDDLAGTNGGEMLRFMGRRSVAHEVLKEIEALEPGFHIRVLQARQTFLLELTTPEKENDD